MAASYKKLFKLLIDRDMKKKELAEKAGISIATITKMGKDGAVVSSEVLVKICSALECKMDDTRCFWLQTSIRPDSTSRSSALCMFSKS